MSMIMPKYKKVYNVTFMQYTNCMKDTVSDDTYDTLGELRTDTVYMKMPENEPLLLTEDQLKDYEDLGCGYRDIVFVGMIPYDEGE